MTPHVPPDVLSAFVDGECDPMERREAHEHLQECAQCRRTMNEYASVHRIVGSLERLSAPEDLVRSAVSPAWRFVDSVRYALRGPRRYVVGAAVAASVLVSLGGLAKPAEQEPPPVDVMMARHASVGTENPVTGQVIFAVTGR